MPYYKFNNMWSRQVQGAVSSESFNFSYNRVLTTSQVEGLLFWGWLGGYKYEGGQVKCGQLLTIEDLGEILHGMCDFIAGTTLTLSSPSQPQGPRRVPPLARRVLAVAHLARRRAGMPQSISHVEQRH